MSSRSLSTGQARWSRNRSRRPGTAPRGGIRSCARRSAWTTPTGWSRSSIRTRGSTSGGATRRSRRRAGRTSRSRRASGPDHRCGSVLTADRRGRFDLPRAPLVRLTIVRRVAPADGCATDVPAHRAVLTFHHALLDGRSLRLLVDEVSAAYAASRDGRVAPDRPRPPFHEFVRWWYTAGSSASEQFWTDYLAGTVLPRSLPGYLGAPVAGTAGPRTA